MNHFLKTKTPNKDEANLTTPRSSDRQRKQQNIDQETAEATSRPKRFAAGLLRRLLAVSGDPPIRFILPDGQEVKPDGVKPVGAVAFKDYRTIWAISLDPLFQFGEAYANGRLEFHGDMTQCLTAIYVAMNRNGNVRTIGQRFFDRLRQPNGNSLRGSQNNIHHHYDIGNDFYKLWLDENMLYTCAYFEHPLDTLEEAQIAKMDHVCRKLQLRPGMTVVEAGCGWGALAIHMATHYGVKVKAFNISSPQIAWARDRARKKGLEGKVEFVQDDWRKIPGKFDAFVSVGMLEHVGIKNYRQLGEKVWTCLKPDGIGLIHTIGQNSPAPFNPWIEERIFPGAYPPSLAEIMQIFEPNGLSVLDVENLRLHYAETLRHWLGRFEDSVDQVRDQFGETFIRMWRMYLAGSVAAFACGYLQLFQVVFSHAVSNNVPRTRSHLYDLTSDLVSRVVKRHPSAATSLSNNSWTHP